MTAGIPSGSPVRRVAPAAGRTASTSQPARAPAQPATQGFSFTGEDKDEFTLDLRDIPKIAETMEVEGFKPSFFSRLLDLIVPRK